MRAALWRWALGGMAVAVLALAGSADAQQPAPQPAPRRRPTRTAPPRKAGPTLPKDTTKAPATPAPAARDTAVAPRPTSAPRADSAASPASAPPPVPATAPAPAPAGAPAGALPAAPLTASPLPAPDASSPAAPPARAAEGRTADPSATDRRVPRGAWRVGAGVLDPFRVLVPVADGINADVRLGAVSLVALEGELRLAGPLRLYATALGGRGTIGHSGALDLQGRPASAAYPSRLAVGSAGVLLAPTFGGAVLQPYLRAGGGYRAMLVDLPASRITLGDPTVDLGGGFRLHGGRVGGFVEARWLRSTFRSATLPLPLVPPATTAQDDLALLVGVRVTR